MLARRRAIMSRARSLGITAVISGRYHLRGPAGDGPFETILHGVAGRWIGTSPLGKGALFIASSMNDTGETVISLDAARLGKRRTRG
jgi:hypothetical protein